MSAPESSYEIHNPPLLFSPESLKIEVQGAVAAALTPEQVQEALFTLWINGIRREMKPYKKIKVPNRVSALPCGCSRETGNEVNANENWYVRIEGDSYLHTFCGKKIGLVKN